METATVLLNDGDKVNRFVAAMSKHICPVYLSTKRYKVDAKSLIGIFGMDLTKPLTVEIGAPNHPVSPEEINAVMQDLSGFILSESV